MEEDVCAGDWRLGLTLDERVAALAETVGDAPSASRRYRERWRVQRRDDLARVRNLDALIAAEPPWWRQFWDIYRASEGIARTSEHGFLAALDPIIAAATVAVRLQLTCSNSSLLPNAGEPLELLLSSLAQSLRDRLSFAVTKTFVLELGVARRAGLLKGDTPEARFSFFCDCLEDPRFASRLLAQYPMLVRRCIGMAAGWQQAAVTLLVRIASAEAKLISFFFSDADPGRCTSVEASGDVHGCGQAVHVLSFASGAKLVYKPRPVAMERCYYDLVVWLNDRGLCPDLKVVRTLEDDTFGWMEFVPLAPCNTIAEVARFYARVGAHLVLTSVLGGTDLHSENVIANGEHPVPVDLETLFHLAPLPDDLSGATARGWLELRRSVVRTLLLPGVSRFGDDPTDFIDLSALGHAGEQLTPSPVAGWARVATDRMRLIYERAHIPPGLSLPQLASQQVPSGAYVDDVVRGFEQCYAFLQTWKDELLGPQGPLSAFVGKPVRRVYRDTAAYALMLFASFHPRFQRNAIACEAMIRDMLRAWSERGSQWLKRLEDVEAADLLACDIPYFFSKVGSADVCGVHGQRVVTLAAVDSRERIDAMSERDLERQVWLIRVAMQDLAFGARAAPTEPASSVVAPSPQALIATAARIGDRICDLAIEDGDRCTWLVPEAVNMRRLVTTVAGFDLYNGLAGIALFLAYLGAVTGDDRYRRVADAATREALALCRKQRSSSAKIGALEGIGGLCFALVHLSAITARQELADEASRLITSFAKRAVRTNELDLMAGLAGFIVTGLVVASFSADRELVENLRPAVERLCRLTTSGRPKLSILSESEAGLAHGRAGAGLALLRWAEATGEAQFRAAAVTLIRKDFERIGGSRREPPADLPHASDPHGWCRGSSGVAMAALAACPPMVDLFEIAAKVMRDMPCAPPSRSLCLCHGALGRLEFLQFARDRLRCDGQVTEIEAFQGAILGRIIDGYWVADTAHTLECPSLMVGLAGTGHALLRAALGNRIPSVLALEGPALA